jgi:ribosomal protein S18 acetylase RimI-like enzyme
VGRLVELYEAVEAEIAPLRGGRVLLGLQGRPAPVSGSFEHQLDDPQQCLVVAVLDGRTVGYGCCRAQDLRGSGKLGIIGELYVVPEARRRGAGRAVVTSLLEWCRATGCAGVDASALPGSRAVKGFFENAGFTARALAMHRPFA